MDELSTAALTVYPHPHHRYNLTCAPTLRTNTFRSITLLRQTTKATRLDAVATPALHHDFGTATAVATRLLSYPQVHRPAETPPVAERTLAAGRRYYVEFVKALLLNMREKAAMQMSTVALLDVS